MKVEFNTYTYLIILAFVAVGSFLLFKDFLHNSEPLENKGDDFGGWESKDHDFNGN